MKKSCVAISCAVALVGAVFADEAESSGWAYNPGEGISFNDKTIVSAEASIGLDSKYMMYGLPYLNKPVITTAAGLTAFDWVYVGITAYYDITKYGSKAGYGNRAWRWVELDPEAGLCHSFTSEEFEWLPTTVDFGLYYSYEKHPHSLDSYDWVRHSQFLTLELGLPDLIFEPVFTYERDIDRDDGTYLNLEVGHTFAVIDGEEENDDPAFTLKPSIAQGFGNKSRVGKNDYGYLWAEDDTPLNRAGLMDTCVKLTAEWNINDYLKLSGYVAYYDFLFDRHIREAARRYEASERWNHSYNFVAGLKFSASF